MSDKNPRQIAFRVLQARHEGDEYTENLLEKALDPSKTRISDPDRSLCQELVYGIVRQQATLDWLIAKKTDSRQQNPGIQNLLRLGLYQIFWLDRIPPHAAVHETVELAKQEGFGPKSGFINAILRGYLREFDATEKALDDLKISNPPLGFSHPQWLVEKWQKRFNNERTSQLLEWNNTPPKTFARCNTLKTDAGKLLEKWRDENVEYDFVRHSFLANLENTVFELKSHPSLASLESFQNGWFYIQDPGTLLAPLALASKPGETILDLCAAPGGKTTFIAQQINNQGTIIACDIFPDRLKLIHENCLRLDVTCVEILTLLQGLTKNASPDEQSPATRVCSQRERAGVRENRSNDNPASVQGEVRGHPPFSIFNPLSLKFDRILIDAPCSNTGVLRRRVDLRWRVSPEEILRLQKTQLDLLKLAVPMLKPGGTLVYSTCSLEPEENTTVIEEFLRAHPAFKLEHQREILPFADNVDGAFVARLNNAG